MIVSARGLGKLAIAPPASASDGNREYNPGWHTAIDLNNLLTVSEAIARAAVERKESRGGHFREDYPGKSEEFSKFNILIRKGADGAMQVVRQPIAEHAR